MVIWLVYLSQPASSLVRGEHGTAGTVWGWTGLAIFVVSYMSLVFRHTSRALERPRVWWILVGLCALSTALTCTLGQAWVVLYVYVAVACGATLPLPLAAYAILTVALMAEGFGMLADGEPKHGFNPGTMLAILLGGFAMTGVRQLVLTTVELRRARATVAQLAANEERLRLARDLHDLLGHSLSLITLKSELAGRMLPGAPDKAAQQVTDIEQVSRQALADVREAVTGYRRPRLLSELAGAEVALTAAGITPVVPAKPDLELPADLTEERESALAWTLREAVTNVVRHSGARRCTIDVKRRQALDGPWLELSVEDDGTGGSATPGNGLTGLTERLEAVGGTLEAASRRRNGFRLLANVPLTTPSAETAPVGSGA
nr:sensor histidine kinase [Streptomyces sp. ODS25]